MRYITVPFCWTNDDNMLLSTDLRLNPVSIEAYHASIMDFEDPDDRSPKSQYITTVITRSGVTYELLIEIKGFEILLKNFNKE